MYRQDVEDAGWVWRSDQHGAFAHRFLSREECALSGECIKEETVVCRKCV